ncbi:MAG: DEAD/DEAH box helicase, partial [Bacteroidia bacterium]
VFIEETPYDERQYIAKEIDLQKRKDDPDFKGAFHEKKNAKQIEQRERDKARATAHKQKVFENKKRFDKKK